MDTTNLLWKKYRILALVAVAVFGYFVLSQYQINHPAQPRPFFTRGLPPPATDVPVVLPPDPGEAGKITLAGIDSDNDGVRDDLQREIVYMYPQNEEVRRVLRAMVKKGQDIITTEGEHEHFKDLMVSYFAFQNCYSFLVFGRVSVNRDYTNTDILWSMIQNTSERSKLFVRNDAKGKPYSTTIYSSSEACTQPLVQGQY